MFTRELSFTYSILKRNHISEALKYHFIIEHYLSVLKPENYTSIQEYNYRKWTGLTPDSFSDKTSYNEVP